jgi:hypothetical protein
MTSPVTNQEGPSKRSKRCQQRETHATATNRKDKVRHVDAFVATTDSNPVPVASVISSQSNNDLHMDEKHEMKSGRVHHRKRRREQDPSSHTSMDRVKHRKHEKEHLTSPTPSQPKNDPMPLHGYVVAVSILQSATSGTKIGRGSSETKLQDRSPLCSYQEVCARCRDLGAIVSELISKRVFALVCTKEAANQATQRVRKAIKRRIPIVSVEWIVACQEHGQLVSMEPYRLDSEAGMAINRRQNVRSLTLEKDLEIEDRIELFDAKIGKVIDLGCCCICHEQGSTANCSWCTNCEVL